LQLQLIVDMCIKFNLGTPTYDQFTINILDIAGPIGTVVDSVSNVIMPTSQQRIPPQMGATLDTEHLPGLGTPNDRVPVLSSIDKPMPSGEMGSIGKLAASTSKHLPCFIYCNYYKENTNENRSS
jgi:purine-binding chemotaxis protein CheW